MIINVRLCCESTAGIYRVSCLEWPHLDVGEVPYGSVCRRSEHIAIFWIWFCSQSFVAYKFNIFVINSRSVCVLCGGSFISPPLKTAYLWGQSSWYFISQYRDFSQLTLHISFLTSLPLGEPNPPAAFLLHLWPLLFNGSYISVFFKIKESFPNKWSLRAIFF